MDERTDEPFGPRLRELRMAAGVSLEEMSRRVHYSKGHLSKIETGSRRPSPSLARQCDAALDAKGELARFAQPPQPAREHGRPVSESDSGAEGWVLEMDDDGSVWFRTLSRRRVLASGAASMLVLPSAGRPMSERAEQEATLTAFTGMFGQLRQLGQRVSPHLMLPTLITQTKTLEHIAATAGGPTRAASCQLASRYAEYVGWMAQEAGQDDAALWWTGRAVSLATEGGDEELSAYSLVRRALVALYAGDGEETVALARRAQRHSGASQRVLGLAAQREAQGFALCGNESECFAALDRANGLLESLPAAGEGSVVLGSSTLRNPVALARAWCLHDLGRPAESAAAFDRELLGVSPAATRFRVRWGTRRALAYAVAGEVDHACALTRDLLADLVTVDSATGRSDLRSLTGALSRRLSHPPVRELFPALTRAMHLSRRVSG